MEEAEGVRTEPDSLLLFALHQLCDLEQLPGFAEPPFLICKAGKIVPEAVHEALGTQGPRWGALGPCQTGLGNFCAAPGHAVPTPPWCSPVTLA